MDMADLERAIAETARAQTSVIAAYLFGSQAAGRAHRESDVDLAVLLEHDALPTASARFETRLRLGAAFAHALGRNDVELVVLNDVPPHFARAIVLDGRRVFVSDVEADHAFRRDAMLRAADLEPFLARSRRRRLECLKR